MVNNTIYRTRVGVTFYVFMSIIVASILLLASLVFLSDIFLVKILNGIVFIFLVVILVFHMIPMVKNTFYRLDDDNLVINAGRASVEIPYTSIISFTCGVKSMLMQPALTFKNRLEIKYKTEGGMTDIVHLSPVNEDAFVALLKSKI